MIAHRSAAVPERLRPGAAPCSGSRVPPRSRGPAFVPPAFRPARTAENPGSFSIRQCRPRPRPSGWVRLRHSAPIAWVLLLSPGSRSPARRCSRSARCLTSDRTGTPSDARHAPINARSNDHSICAVRPRHPMTYRTTAAKIATKSSTRTKGQRGRGAGSLSASCTLRSFDSPSFGSA